MALTPNQIEQVDLYVDGLLEGTALAAFEAELSVNAELQAEVDKHLLLMDGLAGLELEHLQSEMSCWETKHQETPATEEKETPVISIKQQKQPKITPIFTIMKKYWIAAALFLAVCPLAIYTFMGSTPSNDSLFAENFVAEEVQPQVVLNRSGSSAEDPENPAVVSAPEIEAAKLKVLLTSGVEAYNRKEYADAVVFFEDYLKTGSETSNAREIRFYMGVSYLAQNNTAKAKDIFKDLSQQPFSIGFQPMKQSSEWYLALTLLKEGDAANAKKRLTKIAKEDKGHPYREQAEKLLAKMDKHQIG